MSNSMRQRADLFACIAIAVLALIVAAAGINTVALTTLLGVPLAMFAPGYAFVLTLFPKRSESRMRLSTRLMFSVGMSIVCTILLSVGMNYAPTGMTRASLTAGLAILTIALSLIADRRGSTIEQGILPGPETSEPKRLNTTQIGLYAVAGLIATGALLLSILEAERVTTNDVIQLWVIPAVASDTAALRTDGTSLRYGMRNINSESFRFNIQLQRNGYTLETHPDLTVLPGQTWEVTTTLRADALGTGPVTALLFTQANPTEPLRRVQYWLKTD